MGPNRKKSKNGCITCKNKHLKCDEKPVCNRCRDAHVVCEGYRKEVFRWRMIRGAPSPSPSVSTSGNEPGARRVWATARSGAVKPSATKTRPPEDLCGPSADLSCAFATAVQAFGAGLNTDTRPRETQAGDANPVIRENEAAGDLSSTLEPVSPNSSSSRQVNGLGMPDSSEAPIPDDDASSDIGILESSHHSRDLDGDRNYASGPTEQPLDPISPSSHSPEMSLTRSCSTGPSTTSSRSITEDLGQGNTLTTLDELPELLFLMDPSFDPYSPEMLMMHFDCQTCGILSIKDGPTDNPWRTLIWPLSGHSSALYHAISSMAAVHWSYDDPSLSLISIERRQESIKSLVMEIENGSLVSALATSLILAFVEGWEKPTGSFFDHLRGARCLVSVAMQSAEMRQAVAKKSTPLRYLCSTFVYVDVFTRLTSTKDHPSAMTEQVLSIMNSNTGGLIEVDPFLGCATSLFPLMSKVADLIQKVRKKGFASLSMISMASQYREELLEWTCPPACMFECFEDTASSVQHSIQSAEATRYAILLYLQQSVPEIPSDPPEVLARKILVKLAGVPPTGRATNLHIFPLLMASCEVTDEDDITWVRERWASIISRLRVRSADCCWEIVQEVWRRRATCSDDKMGTPQFRMTSSSSKLRDPDQILETLQASFGGTRDQSRGSLTSIEIPHLWPLPSSSRVRRSSCTTVGSCSHEQNMDYTISGRLHWLRAMEELGWEVFFG